MSATMNLSKAEYLKKYLSGSSSTSTEKKKRKKSKPISSGLLVVEEEAFQSVSSAAVPDVGSDEEEEVRIEAEIKKKVDAVPKFRSAFQSVDSDDIKKEVDSEEDASGSRSLNEETITSKHQSDESRLRGRNRSDSDVSPSRRSSEKNKNDDASPPRKFRRQRKDSDSSPHRKEPRDSVDSPRKAPIKRRDSDTSPPRRSGDKRDDGTSPFRRASRQRSDPDAFYPRRTGEEKKEDASSRWALRQRRDSDASPPRRSGEKKDANASSRRVSRQRRDSDASPPRRSGGKRDDESSPSRRVPRQRIDSDASPPRENSREWGYSEVYAPRRTDNSPPPRRTDNSPPPRRTDNSPPRKKLTDIRSLKNKKVLTAQRDLSPVRQRNTITPQIEKTKMIKKEEEEQKTLDGKKAGLSRSAKERREESQLLRQKEREMMIGLEAEVSGRGAETVIRAKMTGRRKEKPEDKEKKEREASKQAELSEKYQFWNKGVAQIQKREEDLEEMVRVANEPLARAADDEVMNQHLIEKIHVKEDPMAKFVLAKRRDQQIISGRTIYPVYEGASPPNRFNIAPGYRWDGVIRGTGFEERISKEQNRKMAVQSENYAYQNIGD